MKFIRYGDLKAFDQKQYEKCPGVSEYPHTPPRRKGFFAFPFAFFDRFYILYHPACEAHSQMVYLRDQNGRKLTENLLEELTKRISLGCRNDTVQSKLVAYS